VELYRFFWGLLAWIATVAILWPVNVPMLALAYKIQNGPKPLTMEREDLWYRSIVAALFVAGITLGFVILDYLVVDWGDFPSGPIHLIIFLTYVPVAAWCLFVVFAYDDLLDGFSLLLIYLGLPIFALFLFNAVFGLWNYVLGFAYNVLKSPV